MMDGTAWLDENHECSAALLAPLGLFTTFVCVRERERERERERNWHRGFLRMVNGVLCCFLIGGLGGPVGREFENRE